MEAAKQKSRPRVGATAGLAATGNNSGSDAANIRNNLPYSEQRVLNFLSRGGRYSVADISAALHMSDPRSSIRNLRRRGVPILDEWYPSAHGSRYKKYFIGKEVGDE